MAKLFGARKLGAIGGALAALLVAPSASALNITPTNDPQELLAALGAQGINVISVAVSPGADFSNGPPTGTYTAAPLGLPNGVLITSGSAINALPPNTSGSTTASYPGPDLVDALCAGLAGTTIHDSVSSALTSPAVNSMPSTVVL